MNIVIGSLAASFIAQGVDATLINNALLEAQVKQQSLIQYFVEQKLIAPQKLAKMTAAYFRLAYVDLNTKDVSNFPLTVVDHKLLKKYAVLPLSQYENELELAIVDPTCQKVQDEIKFYSNLTIKLVIVEYDKLENILELVLNLQNYTEIKQAESIEKQNEIQIIEFVSQIINDAVYKKASDIHFEPFAENYRIRFRIDGILYDIIKLPLTLMQRITVRLKILGQMDIAEHRLPQDGRFSFQSNQNSMIDCRVNSCPTLFGEKIVVRLLQPDMQVLNIDELGFDEPQKNIFLASINRPQGMVLVTGPTGSGKTVTLYTALSILNQSDKNISTVEDPVEIRLPGINQLQINIKAELDFAKALRAFLRQDPDIIMIGEMRDKETANTAIKAAQTGHLVFSTLHTNSAVESLTRLVNMGIAPFNITGAVTLIIAQRLVRKLCNSCKKQQYLPASALINLGFSNSEIKELVLYEPVGCKLCTNGYLGRIGIYEVLKLTPAIVNLLLENAAINIITEHAKSNGLVTLYQSGLRKVAAGITSLAEVQRVVGL